MSVHRAGFEVPILVKSRNPSPAIANFRWASGSAGNVRQQRKSEQMWQVAYSREYFVMIFRGHPFNTTTDVSP